MNKLHKLVNQPVIESYAYCADYVNTYTITIVKTITPEGTELLESWYNLDNDGVAHHACGLVGDNEENRQILLNEAIQCIKEDYEN